MNHPLMPIVRAFELLLLLLMKIINKQQPCQQPCQQLHQKKVKMIQLAMLVLRFVFTRARERTSEQINRCKRSEANERSNQTTNEETERTIHHATQLQIKEDKSMSSSRGIGGVGGYFSAAHQATAAPARASGVGIAGTICESVVRRSRNGSVSNQEHQTCSSGILGTGCRGGRGGAVLEYNAAVVAAA